jgi:hypothetical protein
MRSYDRNGIDIGAGEQCLVVANEIEFLLRSESRGHRRADIATCHDFEARATCKTNQNRARSRLAMPKKPLWPSAGTPKNAIDVAFGGKADMTYCGANVRF